MSHKELIITALNKLIFLAVLYFPLQSLHDNLACSREIVSLM